MIPEGNQTGGVGGSDGQSLPSSQGIVPPSQPNEEHITFTSCGASAIKSTDIGEWYQLPYEYFYPHCIPNNPVAVAQMEPYPWYKPTGMKFRIFNLQVTSETSPTNFNGLQPQAEFLIYIDNDRLYSPCANPENKKTAFTDIFLNERHLHNGFDANGTMHFPSTVKLKQVGMYKVTETCAEVHVKNCNQQDEFTYSYKSHCKYPRHISEWKDQELVLSNTKTGEVAKLYRFDEFNRKRWLPFRTMIAGFCGRRVYVKDNGGYVSYPQSMDIDKWTDQHTDQKKRVSLGLFDSGTQEKLFIKEIMASTSYMDVCNLPDISEHNPMPGIFFKLNTMVGPQGNRLALKCTFNWEYEYSFKFFVKTRLPSTKLFLAGESTDTWQQGYNVPSIPYSMPVFLYVKDKEDKAKRLFPMMSDIAARYMKPALIRTVHNSTTLTA